MVVEVGQLVRVRVRGRVVRVRARARTRAKARVRVRAQQARRWLLTRALTASRRRRQCSSLCSCSPWG